MKFRLILISCILSIFPLFLFQIYYYYSTESIIIDGLNKSNSVEITNSSEDISEKLQSALGTISLLSQLSLPKVSLEFTRPEALNEFLEASNKRSGLFERMVVLDSNFEFFASNGSGSDVFTLIENNQKFKDIAKELASSQSGELIKSLDRQDSNIVDFYVGAKIVSEGNGTVGYLIGNIRESVLVNSIGRLRSRIKLNQKEELVFKIINSDTSNIGLCAPIVIGGHKSPRLCVEHSESGIFPWLGKNFAILLITIVFLGFVYALIYQFFIGRILNPLYEFLRNLTKITEGNFVKQSEDSRYSEINSLISATNSIVDKLKINQAQEYEKVRIEAVAKVATQAAHDIRSPLEMLKGIKDDIAPLPEESRRRIQMGINRIEEITFNLLKTHKQTSQILPAIKSEELLSLITSVVTEKNIEYRTCTEITIKELYDTNSYGLFSKIHRNSLKSIISNLVNNAIESFNGKRGIVTVTLNSYEGRNAVSVHGNGPAIDPNVSDMIFTKGFTTKTNGNGIGLYNAKLDLEAVGGTLSFTTEIGKGTTFTISLPKSEAPPSFIASIDAYKYDRIIVLDDDSAFHEVWNKRLEGLESKVEHIYSVEVMFSKYQVLHPKILLLSDFELMDKDLDGIDTILKLGHSEYSVLVTARNEEQAIQDRCLAAGIKILPKSLVNYVEVIKDESCRPQIILIDDDRLIHINWSNYCKKSGLSFKSFKSIEEFLKVSSSIDNTSRIFIDSNLGDGIKGEIESEKIFALGFLNLYLATGYEKGSVQRPAWIKEVFSKSPENIG